MRIDVFFKKKIITIYLHLGARKGKRRWAGLVLFTRDTEGEGGLEEVEAWGEGRGPRGRRFSMPPTLPILPSLHSPQLVEILLKSPP